MAFSSGREELGELGEKEREFVCLIALAEPDRFLVPFCGHGKGSPSESRLSLLKAFMAKGRCSTIPGRRR